MGTFQLFKLYDKAHIFRAKYGRIDFALGRWTTTVGQNAPKSMKALVRFPNPHYVVGWGTEPLHRG